MTESPEAKEPNPIVRAMADHGSLDREAVRGILPYGDAFLFVDRVEALGPETITTTFRIPDSAPYLDSHFRGLPIMPGALMSEAFAQAGAILVRSRLDDHHTKDIVGTQVESARFLSPALPGDLLRFEVELKTLGRHAARLAGGAWIGERQVGRMKVVVAIVERQALRAQIAEFRGA